MENRVFRLSDAQRDCGVYAPIAGLWRLVDITANGPEFLMGTVTYIELYRPGYPEREVTEAWQAKDDCISFTSKGKEYVNEEWEWLIGLIVVALRWASIDRREAA